ILCGLCVRVCETAATSAIATTQRGRKREVGAPFGDVPPDCIGCTACAQVCPTGHIVYSEEDGVRTIWGKRFEMLRCQKCGAPFMTVEQRDLLLKTRDLDAGYYELCPSCKRQRTAETMADVVLKTHPHFVPKPLGGSDMRWSGGACPDLRRAGEGVPETPSRKAVRA
ncbi:MAG: 4Fe-4S dicluster domain-containing protein, partial [Deltaproteobacteria bacterium]|nr:4Fe-4S dicluster domain-containing protein [Deltaproteobacteria bacterium]